MNKAIEELSNLSQTSYSPSMQGEATMGGLTQPYNSGRNGIDMGTKLATDVSKIVSGINNFAKVQYDLSEKATKRMAIDHKLGFVEASNAILGEKSLSEEDKKKYITEAVGNYADLSAKYLEDNQNLKDIYDDTFTNQIRETYSRTMLTLDNAIYQRDIGIEKNEVARVASGGNTVTLEDIKSVGETLLKDGIYTESDMIQLHSKSINAQLNKDIDLQAANGIEYANNFIIKHKNGQMSFNKDFANTQYASYFRQYGSLDKNGQFKFNENVEANEPAKEAITSTIAKYAAVAKNQIDSNNLALQKAAEAARKESTSSRGNDFVEEIKKLVTVTGTNGKNIDTSVFETPMSKTIYDNLKHSDKKAWDKAKDAITNNIEARNVTTDYVRKVFTKNDDKAINGLNDALNGGMMVFKADGSPTEITSEMANSVLEQSYNAIDTNILNIENDADFSKEVESYINKQKTLGKYSSLIKTANNVAGANLDLNASTPKQYMRYIQINDMYKRLNGQHKESDDLAYSNIQRLNNSLPKPTEDMKPEVRKKLEQDNLRTLKNEFNTTKQFIKNTDYDNTIKKFGTDLIDEAVTGFGWLAPEADTDVSVVKVFNAYMANQGVKVSDYSNYKDMFKSMTSRNEGYVMGIASSMSPGKSSSYALRPNKVPINDEEFKNGIQFIMDDVLKDDINNYSFGNTLDSDGNILLTISRVGTNMEDSDTYTLSASDIKKAHYSYSKQMTTTSIKEYTDKMYNKLRKKR